LTNNMRYDREPVFSDYRFDRNSADTRVAKLEVALREGRINEGSFALMAMIIFKIQDPAFSLRISSELPEAQSKPGKNDLRTTSVEEVLNEGYELFISKEVIDYDRDSR